MRVSIDANDPGNAAYQQLLRSGKRVFPYLDGVLVKRCFTVDDDAGYIKAAVLDADGKFQVDASGESILTYEKHGDVLIEIRDA